MFFFFFFFLFATNVSQKAGVNQAKWDLGVALGAWGAVTKEEEGYVEFTHWPAYNARKSTLRLRVLRKPLRLYRSSGKEGSMPSFPQ